MRGSRVGRSGSSFHRSNSVVPDALYPQIEQEVILKFKMMSKLFPTRKNVTAGNQTKYVNVTQIFDESTQNSIKSIEAFFRAVVKDKLYWTRSILEFFGIKNEDIDVFLNFHQIYKMQMNRKM